MTSPVLLQLLIVRFKGPSLTDSMSKTLDYAQRAGEIQACVARVVSTWIRTMPSLWKRQRQLAARLHQFLKGLKKSGLRELMRRTASEHLDRK